MSGDTEFLNKLIKGKKDTQDRWYAAGVGAEGKYGSPTEKKRVRSASEIVGGRRTSSRKPRGGRRARRRG